MEPRQKKVLQLALIGCGEHSQENLIPCFGVLSNARIVAVCDTDQHAAAQAAHRLGNCNVKANFKELLDLNDLDAIVVAAPPQVHHQTAFEALRRGLHVFVEKPATATRKELFELTVAAHKRGLVTCVGHNLRHATAAIQMWSLLNTKKAQRGDKRDSENPVAMELRYFASKPRGDRWGLNSPLRSFLLSHASHAIDFMLYQMGPIQRVSAALASSDTCGITLSVQFAFVSGAVGSLLATSSAPHFIISGTVIGKNNCVVQLNSLNEIVAYGVGDDRKRWGRCWTSKTLLTGYEGAGYLKELEDFVEAVRQNRPDKCHPSFKDELLVYEVIDAIEEKVAGGKLHFC